MKRKNYKLSILILIIFLIIAGAMTGLLIKDRFVNKNKPYYAVFLTNNDVYFGQIKKSNDKEMVISPAYYLQKTSTPATSKKPAENQVALASIKSEVHGPTDEIIINKASILYYEKLAEDSNVLKSIREYKNK